MPGAHNQRRVVDCRIASISDCDLCTRLVVFDLGVEFLSGEQVVVIDCKNDIARPYAHPLSGSTSRDVVESYSTVSDLGILVR